MSYDETIIRDKSVIDVATHIAATWKGSRELIRARCSIVLHTDLFKYLTGTGATSSSSFNGIRLAEGTETVLRLIFWVTSTTDAGLLPITGNVPFR